MLAPFYSATVVPFYSALDNSTNGKKVQLMDSAVQHLDSDSGPAAIAIWQVQDLDSCCPAGGVGN